ncbi:putative aldouronate transport system permease protein [Cohnella sp. OV330]|uniref:ABC transporter permease n=1 Tax=Cohnella sp. OV330 TaxID=1855288 RepID=UPI0008E2A2F9|nr:ABC transporter permease subunit [Cohnella sp. OV330]SFA74292.1 putative aldouronate transport system permease protein [Cohnella sp. OV330]
MKAATAIRKDFARHKSIYLMAAPVILYYLIFHYTPIYGAIIAFKNFQPAQGIWGSKWVGFDQFDRFFHGYYFWRLLKNTLLISLYSILFGFPAPILLALLLNELRMRWFKRVVQTVTYLPHFISVIVISGILIDFISRDGLLNDLFAFFGADRVAFLAFPQYFRTIFVSSSIWQEVGWGSIIYLAALSAINPELYEAAKIDGAGRFKQIRYITIPSLVPIMAILLILRIGHVMEVGFEKIILLYRPTTYETADVIASYIYREGLGGFNYSYSAAIGLFQSVVNLALLYSAHRISKRMNGSGLW